MFSYKKIRIIQLQKEDDAQRVAFSQLYTDNVSCSSGFLRQVDISYDCVFQGSG